MLNYLRIAARRDEGMGSWCTDPLAMRSITHLVFHLDLSTSFGPSKEVWLLVELRLG